MSSSIFISYSHKDKESLNTLQMFLNPILRDDPLLKDKEIILWNDKQINSGDKWREKIDDALAAADMAILLVSQNFLNSEFINQHELPVILEAVSENRLSIKWIHISPSTVKASPIQEYQALGNPQIPLTKLSKVERLEEWVRICEEIADSFRKAEVVKPTSENKPDNKEKETSVKQPPPLPETNVDSGDLAIEGMTAMVTLMQNPQVFNNMVEFESIFNISSDQIEKLSYYKDLHDHLHTLQIQYYEIMRKIVRKIRVNPGDSSVWGDAVEYEENLQNIIDKLTEASKHEKLFSTVSWVSGLIANLELLSEGVANKNVEGIIIALRPIQSTLTRESVRLNDRLIQASNNLQLMTLINALKRVQSKFDNNSVIMNKFKNGVEALNNLHESLNILRDEHDKWQNIDFEIRKIDGTISEDVDELRFCWSEVLKPKTEEICQGNNEKWAQLIINAVNILDKSLLTDAQETIRDDYLRYRTRASNRFFLVDLELKELCQKLRQVGDHLTTAWEMINERH